MDKNKLTWAFRDDPDAENTNKRVRRHTWTDSPEQDSNPSKKPRHFSAPNAGASSGPDLLGSILSGMKSPKAETSKWEGQPNYSELGGKKQETKWEGQLNYSELGRKTQETKWEGQPNYSELGGKTQETKWEGQPNYSELSGKKQETKWEGQPNYSELGGKTQETKWEDRLVIEEPSSQWWSTDPLQLEASSTAMVSSSSKSNNNLSKPLTAEQLKPFQKFRKADKSVSRNIEKEREKLQAKARSLDYNSNHEKDKKLAKGIDVEWEPPKNLTSKKINKSNEKKNDERSHGKREKDIKKDVKKEKSKKSDSKKENDSGLVNFNKKRSGIGEKSKVKTSETPNGRGGSMGGAQNTDKEFKKNIGDKKKYTKEMEGTKSWRSKSSWKGAGNLGSTRKAWRPDRAYDFSRNHMEINDVETPNDDFELARIV